MDPTKVMKGLVSDYATQDDAVRSLSPGGPNAKAATGEARYVSGEAKGGLKWRTR